MFVILRKFKNKMITSYKKHLFKNNKKVDDDLCPADDHISPAIDYSKISPIVLDISNRCSISTLYNEKEIED